MKIHLPQALNELGNRQNNEDAIFPPIGSAGPEDRLFLVCDGVGGQEKGEIASALICKHFHQYVKTHERGAKPGQLLPEALVHVEETMRTYIANHPASSGMASTLTCALLQPKNVLIGWVGDSRVYHIRDGQILFQSKDHSQVQWLIDNGEITEAQAERHPQKNVILRAVNGSQPTEMDQHVLEDIRPDDFLFLCTDGILETLGKPEISRWFRSNHSPEQIKQEILKNATGKTRDNFSMYLLKIQQTHINETTAPIKSEQEEPSNPKHRDSESTPHYPENSGKRNLNWIIPVVFLLVIIALILSYLWPKDEKTAPPETIDETELVDPDPTDEPSSTTNE